MSVLSVVVENSTKSSTSNFNLTNDKVSKKYYRSLIAELNTILDEITKKTLNKEPFLYHIKMIGDGFSETINLAPPNRKNAVYHLKTLRSFIRNVEKQFEKVCGVMG